MIERLATVARDIAFETLTRSGFARITVDIDGTVQRTGLLVEGPALGVCPSGLRISAVVADYPQRRLCGSATP
jgi:hypothetical protein